MGGWLRRIGGEVGEGTAEGGTCFRCEVQEKSIIRGIKSIRGDRRVITWCWTRHVLEGDHLVFWGGGKVREYGGDKYA